MEASYDASQIRVLKGLEAVRVRPRMYTDLSSPQSAAQQVLECSVYDALAGYGSRLDVTLFADGSLQVDDDGREIPVQVHPLAQVPFIQMILGQLHCGAAKPSDAALAGLSIVNGLSKRLDCRVRSGGLEHTISYHAGELHTGLTVTGTTGPQATGMTLRFWPDPALFESASFSVPELTHQLRAMAALCPGLRTTLYDEAAGDTHAWCFPDGLGTYLVERMAGEGQPAEPITGGCHADGAIVDYALRWAPAPQPAVRESYIDLRHGVDGSAYAPALRAGIRRALRQHRGTAERSGDLAAQASWVLSVRTEGRAWPTQRCDARHAVLIEGAVNASVSRWCTLHPGAASRLACWALL